MTLTEVVAQQKLYDAVIARLRCERGFKGKDETYMINLAGDILRSVGLLAQS